MSKNIIVGIETVIKGLEMIKVELISQTAKEDVVVQLASLLGGQVAPVKVETTVEVKEEVKPSKKEEEVVVDTDEDEDDQEDVDVYTEESLEEMSYNDLKALVSSLGGKAIGNKAKLIEIILGLQDGDEEEEVKEEVKPSKKSVKKEEVEADDEEEEEEDEIVNEDEFINFLNDLDSEDLVDIANELGVKVKKVTKKNRDEVIENLTADLDKLEKALEELGYYDGVEEEEEETEEEVEADEENEEDEEDGEDLAEELGLNEMSVDELADILADHELSTKGKKQALIDRIVKGVEDGTIELDEEEEEEEEEVKPAPKGKGKGKNGKK